jgi:AcrR family transcriptional regulator
MIIDAVMPLLLEFGPAVTSRQIAHAAGVAEGTVYRVFGDKEALIQAVLERHLDPAPLRRALEAIDPQLPLAEKVFTVVTLMQHRFREVFGLLSMFPGQHRPSSSRPGQGMTRIFERLLEPDRDRLNCSPSRVAQVIRLLTFSSALPQLNEGVVYTADELTAVILHGIAGSPGAPAADARSTVNP